MVLGKQKRHMQKRKLDCYLSPQTKNNSKWIKGLNTSPKTINYIEENIATKLMNLGVLHRNKTAIQTKPVNSMREDIFKQHL